MRVRALWRAFGVGLVVGGLVGCGESGPTEAGGRRRRRLGCPIRVRRV